MEKESKLYRLVEMYDSMNESIRNIEKVKEEQFDLIDVLKTYDNSNGSNKFESLIEQLKQQLDDLENQSFVLKSRAESLNEANILIDTRQDCADVVERLIFALGLFEEA